VPGVTAQAGRLDPTPRLTGRDLVQRTVVALALCVFVWRAYQSYVASPRLSLLLLLLSETLTVVLVVLARPPEETERRPYAVALTAVGTFYFLLIVLKSGIALVPPHVGVAVQLVGVGLQFASKLWLGRRFGLLPANRGIVTTGPYRLLRRDVQYQAYTARVRYRLIPFLF
jgi:protein-S-isoprenylcysteine O-methyltransferase Ste14